MALLQVSRTDAATKSKSTKKRQERRKQRRTIVGRRADEHNKQKPTGHQQKPRDSLKPRATPPQKKRVPFGSSSHFSNEGESNAVNVFVLMPGRDPAEKLSLRHVRTDARHFVCDGSTLGGEAESHMTCRY